MSEQTRRLVALAAAHHRQVLALRQITGRKVASAWDRVANVDESAAVRFAVEAAKIVDASKLQIAAFAVALKTSNDSTIGRVARLVPVMPEIRGGIATRIVYDRAIVTARSMLADGKEWSVAMDAGRARAVSAAQTDVILANREAIAADAEVRPWVLGYRRVLSGESCDLCALAADRFYKSANLAPIHNRCDCDVIEIVSKFDPASALNRSARGDREPEEGLAVAVHEHGELGPVLTIAGQEFTGPEDVAA